MRSQKEDLVLRGMFDGEFLARAFQQEGHVEGIRRVAGPRVNWFVDSKASRSGVDRMIVA
jgi:hypothetical protein